MQGGDIIVELAGKKIENIYDYTYAIEALKTEPRSRLSSFVTKNESPWTSRQAREIDKRTSRAALDRSLVFDL